MHKLYERGCIVIGALTMLLMLNGCGHNGLAYTNGTAINLGYTPQTEAVGIQWMSGEAVMIGNRENTSLEMEISDNSTVGAGVTNSVGLGKITKLKYSVGMQINGYTADVLSANPELAKNVIEALRAKPQTIGYYKIDNGALVEITKSEYEKNPNGKLIIDSENHIININRTAEVVTPIVAASATVSTTSTVKETPVIKTEDKVATSTVDTVVKEKEAAVVESKVETPAVTVVETKTTPEIKTEVTEPTVVPEVKPVVVAVAVETPKVETTTTTESKPTEVVTTETKPVESTPVVETTTSTTTPATTSTTTIETKPVETPTDTTPATTTDTPVETKTETEVAEATDNNTITTVGIVLAGAITAGAAGYAAVKKMINKKSDSEASNSTSTSVATEVVPPVETTEVPAVADANSNVDSSSSTVEEPKNV